MTTSEFLPINFKKGKYGISFSFHGEKLIQWIKENVNEKGYINGDINEKKNPDEKSTHYAKIWIRKQVNGDFVAPENPNLKPMNEIRTEDNNTDNLPF